MEFLYIVHTKAEIPQTDAPAVTRLWVEIFINKIRSMCLMTLKAHQKKTFRFKHMFDMAVDLGSEFEL